MRLSLLVCIGCMICSATVAAQTYPTRPIRLVLGAAPGGSADAGARILAPKLAQALGQSIVIDNRPGANNNVATEIVARAPANGYTLLYAYSAALAVNPSLYDKLPFDPLKDFTHVQPIASFQFILVLNKSVTAASVKDLVAQMKNAKPGQFQYASAGVGSPNHLAAELFKARAGVNADHVPYKSGGPATLSLIAGETRLYFASLSSVIPHVKAGTMKGLAVTGPKRSPELPDVPTMQESGYPGFDVTAWHGIVVPAGTPKSVVDRLNKEIVKVLHMSDVQEGFRRTGLDIMADVTPQQAAARIRSETVLWAKVIKNAGIKAE
ncbi:MAG TPA: tripartite tricarboxylate transporter substrate binding protein [Burkholderiales bacterium]|nr:tripartite tricarboxylate transporter substrate binding protein [Burkholderiales bacterium]